MPWRQSWRIRARLNSSARWAGLDALATDLPASPINVCCWGKSGKHLLTGSFSQFDRAARLAAIPAGESPGNRRSPVTVVVISSDGEGDRSVGSLEVKVPEGWGVSV